MKAETICYKIGTLNKVCSGGELNFKIFGRGPGCGKINYEILGCVYRERRQTPRTKLECFCFFNVNTRLYLQ